MLQQFGRASMWLFRSSTTVLNCFWSPLPSGHTGNLVSIEKRGRKAMDLAAAPGLIPTDKNGQT